MAALFEVSPFVGIKLPTKKFSNVLSPEPAALNWPMLKTDA
jgi:hypothetical protein